MLEDGWQHVGGHVAERVVGMVVRRGQKTTDFRKFLGFGGADDIGERVGLVKPKRCGVVLIKVAVVWERGCRE